MTGRPSPALRTFTFNATELLRRPGQGRQIDASVTTAELGLDDDRFVADELVTASLTLESLNDGIVVLGQIDVPWHGTCRRCLKVLDEHEVSLVDELYQTVVTNPDAFEIVGDQLDLSSMVREHALLDAPESPLCQPDCAGLCPICGIDLNSGSCDCVAPMLGSPFDALNALRDQLDSGDEAVSTPDSDET
ncbi:MAG: DUF177 domain-containing protein [Ilumatobacteraceae bacterium]